MCGARLLCAVLCAVGAPALARGTPPPSCAALRAGNPRALFVAKWDKSKLPSVLSAMMDAGFETGVLFERCRADEATSTRTGVCVYDAWAPGQAHGLRFVRTTSLLHRSDVIDAVADFAPSLVLFLNDARQYVVSAARSDAVASETAEEGSRRARAAAILRCSLPAERFWGATLRKSELLELAARLGVRVPWSVPVPARMGRAALEAAAREVPVAIKSDLDGSGNGVTLCHTPGCARAALLRCAAPCGRGNCTACVRQQLVVGHTISWEAAAVDGRLLGGFGRAEVLTRGRTGFALASVTLNAPEAADAMRRLLASLEYTGVAAADFVVEAATGHAFLIDPNLRMGMNLIIDGVAAGLGAGLLDRLRAALASPTRPDRWAAYAPLRRSITYGLFTRARPVPAEVAYCPDVYLAVPWRFWEWLPAASEHQLVGSREACEVAHVALPERRLRQACGGLRAPCADRCAPLATVPVLSAADVARELCDPTGDWARAHASCLTPPSTREQPLARASRAAGAGAAGSRFAAATQRLAPASSAERYWLRQRADPAWPLFTTTAFGVRRPISAAEKLANLPTIGTLCRGGGRPPPAGHRNVTNVPAYVRA